MDVSNIQEWMKSGGDTEDKCIQNGEPVGYDNLLITLKMRI